MVHLEDTLLVEGMATLMGWVKEYPEQLWAVRSRTEAIESFMVCLSRNSLNLWVQFVICDSTSIEERQDRT